jgi:hypothetical protein
VNSLKSPTYLTPILAIANIHDLFEKTSTQEESIIETFYIHSGSTGGDISAELSDEADDEHMHKVLEKETYLKMELPTAPAESKPP